MSIILKYNREGWDILDITKKIEVKIMKFKIELLQFQVKYFWIK